ncbi:MAG: S8 family serine peptidase, partial [Pyrinomonadaceae bacterium]|nr:S8 family serine peptidase [Pyrinomonadaceae bacterium]
MSVTFMMRVRQATALSLILLLALSTVKAGIVVTGADGIVVTGADGIVVTGADGIVTTGADGIVVTGADGIVTTGADGIVATGADGIVVTGANGIVATGADGIVATGADGTRYELDSIYLRQPNGIGIRTPAQARMTGTDGIVVTGADGIVATGADGIVATGADGIVATGADGIVATGADGRTFTIAPNGIVVTGADTITMTRAAGIVVTGADGIVVTGADGIVTTGADSQTQRTGLLSVDPELLLTLDRMTDDSSVNAVVLYHHLPTDADLTQLQSFGITGGTRFHQLPMVVVTATRDQIIAVSKLAAVRSIYGNRTLQLTAAPDKGTAGIERVRQDADLSRHNQGLPVSGRGVTVAVLDTGVDSTHADLSGRVAQNVKLADTMSAGVGFNYPANIENLPNTDQFHGHGTFVAGVIGGNGGRSGGAYTGVAPGARIVGLSAGDLNLFYVLDGFDYLLERGASLGVRVVNCSFSANTIYDANDPVNVATKMLTGRGINVVFSAGNTGAGLGTMNPYAVAPWVVSVGATDYQGRVANFSSRGQFGSQMFRPTIVAPGVKVVSLRSTGVSVTGVEGVGFNGDAGIAPSHVPFYTTASGTSFSAPQVAGVIALMLEANPRLTPAQVRDILQRTATPLPPYYAHEVGAGMLNAHAAVLEAAFPQRRMGSFKATLNRGQVRFVNEPVQEVSGTVQPSGAHETNFVMPENTLLASLQIGWSSLSVNDLGLALYDAQGFKRADVNAINLPGLTGKRERVVLEQPQPGAWNMRVKNTLPLAVTTQNFSGTIEIMRAEYAPLGDLNSLSATAREEIYQSLRTFVMYPSGNRFRPTFAVTRAGLAEALVLGGRTPQYLPAAPTYRDVRDPQTMLFVESVQRAPRGPIFTDVSAGGNFSPAAATDRLTAAIALVRAAGLRAEAESS